MKTAKASVLLIGLPTLGALLILSGDVSGSRIALPRKNPPPVVAGSAVHPIAGTASRKLGAKIAKTASAENRRVKEVAAEMTQLSREELDHLLDPRKMTEGGIGK